jgi:hypothetical protein
MVQQAGIIGINLLKAGLMPDANTPPVTYDLGGVQWALASSETLGPSVQTIYAFNPSLTDEVGINYTVSTLEGTSPKNLSLYQPIPPYTWYDAKDDLDSVKSGHVCVGKVGDVITPPLKGNVLPPVTVSFSLQWFNVLSIFNIFRNVDGSCVFDTTAGVYQIVLSTSGPHLLEAHATIKVGGTRAAAHISIGEPSFTNNSSYSLTFGKGLAPSSVIESLNLVLTVERESYLRATEERRKNVVKGLPPAFRRNS